MTDSNIILCKCRKAPQYLTAKGKLNLRLPTTFYKLQFLFFQPEKLGDSIVTYLITWLASKWNRLQENQSSHGLSSVSNAILLACSDMFSEHWKIHNTALLFAILRTFTFLKRTNLKNISAEHGEFWWQAPNEIQGDKGEVIHGQDWDANGQVAHILQGWI